MVKKVIVVSAAPDICPSCPIFKVHLKRLLRRKFKDFKFEELDVSNPSAKILIAERGVWFYSPEDDDVQFPIPQAFVVLNGDAYFLFGNPLWIEEMIDGILEKRLKEYSEGRNYEELHKKFLKEDICDPTNETVVNVDGKDYGVPLCILRPDVCKEELDKMNLDSVAKRLREHIENVLSTRFEEVKRKVLS